MGSESENTHTHYHHTSRGFFDIFSIRNILHVLVAVCLLFGYYFKNEVFVSKIGDAAEKIENGLTKGEDEITRLENLVKTLQEQLQNKRSRKELIEEIEVEREKKMPALHRYSDLCERLQIEDASLIDDLEDEDMCNSEATVLIKNAANFFELITERQHFTTKEFKLLMQEAPPREKAFAAFLFAMLFMHDQENLANEGVDWDDLPNSIKVKIFQTEEINVCRFIIKIRSIKTFETGLEDRNSKFIKDNLIWT